VGGTVEEAGGNVGGTVEEAGGSVGVLFQRVPQKRLLLVLVAVWEVLVGGVMHFFFHQSMPLPTDLCARIVILLEVVFIHHHAM